MKISLLQLQKKFLKNFFFSLLGNFYCSYRAINLICKPQFLVIHMHSFRTAKTKLWVWTKNSLVTNFAAKPLVFRTKRRHFVSNFNNLKLLSKYQRIIWKNFWSRHVAFQNQNDSQNENTNDSQRACLYSQIKTKKTLRNIQENIDTLQQLKLYCTLEVHLRRI